MRREEEKNERTEQTEEARGMMRFTDEEIYNGWNVVDFSLLVTAPVGFREHEELGYFYAEKIEEDHGTYIMLGKWIPSEKAKEYYGICDDEVLAEVGFTIDEEDAQTLTEAHHFLDVKWNSWYFEPLLEELED